MRFRPAAPSSRPPGKRSGTHLIKPNPRVAVSHGGPDVFMFTAQMNRVCGFYHLHARVPLQHLPTTKLNHQELNALQKDFLCPRLARQCPQYQYRKTGGLLDPYAKIVT